MLFPPIQATAGSGFRSAREPGQGGAARRCALEGSARPGAVLALAGVALVRDLDAHGLVDGHDAPVARGAVPVPAGGVGSVIDVRA